MRLQVAVHAVGRARLPLDVLVDLGHAVGVELLLHDGLGGDDLGQALQARRLQPRGRVGLQSGDDARLGDFVGPGVLHVDGLEEQDVGFGVRDARGDGFHYLAVDRLFVVRDEVLVEEFLDLVGGEPGMVLVMGCVMRGAKGIRTSNRYLE